MNSKRRSECYNMIAEAGYERRDWNLKEVDKFIKSAAFKMELACKIQWESVEEFELTYDWCIRKFFEDAEDEEFCD